jgi:hypothetical protein
MEFNHASEAFRRLNPHLFGVGAVQGAKPQPGGRDVAARSDAPKEGSPSRVVVCLVGYRRRILDDDNFVGASKWLRDAIAESLGVDDGDKRLRWEYSQVETRGAEGTAVLISTP